MKNKNSYKIGVSTWVWTSPFSLDTLTLFPKIKAMGFDVVEIPIEYPDLIPIRWVKQALHDHGLSAVVCGAFGPNRDFTNPSKEVQQECRNYIKRCFDFCEEWGSGFLAGPMYAAVGKFQENTESARLTAWRRTVENLHQICEEASSRNLSLAIEPLNRFESDLVNTTADVNRLIRDINHPAAKIMLDSFHMMIEETDLARAIEEAGDRLIHLQVSDSHRGIPGSGLTPWTEIRKGLDLINYQGTVSIESFTPEIKSLAGAVCIWRKFADNQDDFAQEGFQFLNELLNLRNND